MFISKAIAAYWGNFQYIYELTFLSNISAGLFLLITSVLTGKEKEIPQILYLDINRMMNHINSYKRKKLNNRSPYETFSFYHGEDVLHKLGCEPVAAGDILLKPSLLKK